MKTIHNLYSKSLLRLHLLLAVLLALNINSFSQDQPRFWNDKAETSVMKSSDRQIIPVQYRTLSVDIDALKNILSKAPMESNIVNAKTSTLIISLPLPDGSVQRFSIVESPIMEPALAAKFPEIKTYLGQGTDDALSSVRCDITPKGFHAMIFSAGGTVFIDPYSKADIENYISYYKKDFIPSPDKIMPEYMPNDNLEISKLPEPVSNLSAGTQLRTYRLALAADSNYYNFQGGTKALTLAAMVISMNRVNFVYEREVAIRMVFIANNDLLIFSGATSPYPYTATLACGLRPENQTKIDAVIGNANYDIGHLFAMSAGGCAAFNSVCNPASKAWGVTGTGNPVGDPFDIDYVAHEIGHQFNAGHTWNGTVGSCSPDQHDASSAYEPGSGTTIMAYAGICGTDNLQPNSDPYFHTRSFDAIVSYSTTSTGNNCPSTTGTGNGIPSVNAGANYTIPRSTPFILTGSGSDPDGDPLTFCWEEFDLGPTGPPNNSSTTGPIFRSFNPVTGTSRTFPKLSDILSNTNTIGEILPSITRTMVFRLTARDNRAGGGGVNYSSMTLNVDATYGPFAVTSPNTSVTWCPGPQTVTWSVNGSDALAANVRILLSTDGGNTFPTTLVASTPNDGSQGVTIPCAYSNTARIKVEAIGNIFFDISNANFAIGDNTPPTFTRPANTTIYTTAACTYNASVAITGDVTNEADNCSTGLNATFTDVTVDGPCEGSKVITRTWRLVDNCGNNAANQVQIITVSDNIPPTFTRPANITIYTDAACGYNASVAVTGDVTNEADNCSSGLNATFTDVTVDGPCEGSKVITRTWRLVDKCGNAAANQIQTITVSDNIPPTFTRPANITIYTDATCSYDASVTATGDVTDEDDNCSTGLNATFTDVTVNGPCIGSKVITRTWRLVDKCGNAAANQIQIITVSDTTGPIISGVSANPSVLWPPNHKMVLVTINYTVTDNCSPASAILKSLSVTSNEAVNGNGDGNTSPDWVVVDAHHVWLRAERSGNGNGRIYTVKISSTDDCGNTSTATVNVYVPHNNNSLVETDPGLETGISLKVMPNPSNNNFTILVNSENRTERMTLLVYDLYGRNVETKIVDMSKGRIVIGDNYIPGSYYIRITQGEKSAELKLIKTAY